MDDTFCAIIDLWPSPAELGQDIGATPGHVRAMRARDSIPDRFWLALVRGAERRQLAGVSLQRLAELSAARGESQSKSPEAGRAA